VDKGTVAVNTTAIKSVSGCQTVVVGGLLIAASDILRSFSPGKQNCLGRWHRLEQLGQFKRMLGLLDCE
jgi:hypothetical protein